MDKVQTFMGQGLRCRVSHQLLGDLTWLVRRPHRVARVWALCLPFPSLDRVNTVSKPDPAKPALSPLMVATWRCQARETG